MNAARREDKESRATDLQQQAIVFPSASRRLQWLLSGTAPSSWLGTDDGTVVLCTSGFGNLESDVIGLRARGSARIYSRGEVLDNEETLGAPPVEKPGVVSSGWTHPKFYANSTSPPPKKKRKKKENVAEMGAEPRNMRSHERD